MEWIIPCNLKMYDVISAFNDMEMVDWRQHSNYAVGDIVYIYVSSPCQRIMFQTEVVATNLLFNEINDDHQYWKVGESEIERQKRKYMRLQLVKMMNSEVLSLKYLKKYGLKSAPQGAIKCVGDKEKLSKYLRLQFSGNDVKTRTLDAIQYVIDEVINPALDSDELDKMWKNKIQSSKNLFNHFKRSGDMFQYLKRFSQKGENSSDLYRALKELGLKTFEDVYDEICIQFKGELYDVTTMNDFVIGESYTSYDIAIFAKTYNVQSGIYLIGEEPDYKAIFIKVTLHNGAYPNEWLDPHRELKYYMYAPNQNYDPSYKVNRAIINSGDTPIYVFIKNDTICNLEGIFKYEEYVTEEDGRKWFRLIKRDMNPLEKTVPLEQYQQKWDSNIQKMHCLKDEVLETFIEQGSKPECAIVVSKVYKRNPAVAVATLRRAAGYCEHCKQRAPFIRKSDQTPYLEVHHKIPLSEGGCDDLENTIALCPNCHRMFHFGM